MGRLGLQVLWPAFVMAGVMETLVFAVVDPAELRPFGSAALDWSRPAVYTASFLLFWGVTAVACSITALLLTEPDRPRDA